MRHPSSILLALGFTFCFAVSVLSQSGAQAVPTPHSSETQGQQDPALVNRPPAKSAIPQSMVTPEGGIHLDVVVTDAAGEPVTDLQPWSFKVLDDGQPRKVLSFRAFNDSTVKPDPPVEVIMVIDTVNLPFQQIAVVRQEVEKFLHENGGHLAQPVSIMLLSDAGLQIQPRSSVEGNVLAGIVQRIKGSIRTVDSAMGGEGLLERFQLCAHQMESIAENEARKPGRKLLIWVGPGWPILSRSQLGYYSEKDQLRLFDGIVELSTKLREARMVVYSIAPANVGAGGGDMMPGLLYQNYLKPVQSLKQADAGNLSLKVLVTQTGGKILGPDNNLAEQIDQCVTDANVFYRISFDPPRADHVDEYRDLKVQVDQPGLTVHTYSGYYNEPPGHQK